MSKGQVCPLQCFRERGGFGATVRVYEPDRLFRYLSPNLIGDIRTILGEEVCLALPRDPSDVGLTLDEMTGLLHSMNCPRNVRPSYRHGVCDSHL